LVALYEEKKGKGEKGRKGGVSCGNVCRGSAKWGVVRGAETEREWLGKEKYLGRISKKEKGKQKGEGRSKEHRGKAVLGDRCTVRGRKEKQNSPRKLHKTGAPRQKKDVALVNFTGGKESGKPHGTG